MDSSKAVRPPPVQATSSEKDTASSDHKPPSTIELKHHSSVVPVNVNNIPVVFY